MGSARYRWNKSHRTFTAVLSGRNETFHSREGLLNASSINTVYSRKISHTPKNSFPDVVNLAESFSI
jgi:hypothetical protein